MNSEKPLINEQVEPSAPPSYQQSEFQKTANIQSTNLVGSQQTAQHQAGYPSVNYPQPGYQQLGYQQAGHPQPGYQQAGHPQPGYQQAGHPQPGYQQAGHPLPGYQQAGHPQPSYQQAGYQQPVYGVPMPQVIPQPVYVTPNPQAMAHQANINSTSTNTSVNVNIGTQAGVCPHCKRGYPIESFTFCGMLCAILLFPIGLICLFAMRTRRCSVCGLNS
jgi:hypothetical protein